MQQEKRTLKTVIEKINNDIVKHLLFSYDCVKFKRKEQVFSMLKVRDLRVNYLKNPQGITGNPQFGWILESDRRNVFQSAYRLQISEDEKFHAPVYDSGRIESDKSVQVFAEGMVWKTLTKYYVRVAVWDIQGEESAWCRTQSFITGLLSPQEWRGKFITAETEQDIQESKGTSVETDFYVKKPLKSAYAAATALGLYRFFINGAKVGKDQFTPGWTSYNKRLLYQVYDVTEYIRQGENSVMAVMGAGWYKGTMGFNRRRNIYGKYTAFSGEIHLNYADGTSEVIASDERWWGSYSPIQFSEIYDGETFDARMSGISTCYADAMRHSCRPVRVLDVNTSILRSQEGCRVRKLTSVPAKKIFTTPEGDTVIDFGQNMTGWVQFKVKGRRGDRVVLRHFETLDAAGNVYLDNLRTAKQCVTYICKGGKQETYHPIFSFQGFRYVLISEYPGTPNPRNFTAYAVHSDMENTGTFTCSNQDVNQLMQNIRWGMKSNFLDIPTDCPQRDERLGWTGDAQIFCRTASYLMNTDAFFRKWLGDMAADQTPEGGVPHVVPDILTNKTDGDWLVEEGSDSAAAWADAAVIIPWTLYLMYGDTQVIRDQYDSMKAWIDFMHSHAENGTWSYRRQFGDWVALDAEEGSYFGATPNELVCAAYYAHSTRLFAKMAEVIGNAEDADKYGRLHEQIKSDYQKFFMKDGHMAAYTQTAQIISLYFELVPEKYKENVIRDLLKLLKEHDGHLVTGFVGTPYFCHALSMSGHTKEAYELLLKDDFPSWLYQVKMGATTVWEHWDGIKPDGTMWSPDMNSFNHYAYGAVGEWLYRVAAGIEVKEEGAGFRKFILQPHPGGGFSYAEGTYESIYGTIKSRWETEGEVITIRVQIPCNTTALLRLDSASEILDHDGLAFEYDGNTLCAAAGSGNYVIRYKRCV